MQCVILAAGKGTRMQPLTFDRPKPLVSVAGRPLLTHILDALPAEVDSYVFVVKYLSDQMREYFGAEYRGHPITYVEQGTPDGTGGAIYSARPVLEERFMVMLADDLHGKGALEALVREPLAILGALSDEPQHFGVLTVSPFDTLVDIEEKPEHPKSNLINTGAMVLDQRIFAYPAPEVHGEVRLTDMATALAKDAPIRVVTQPLWCPVGRPEDIAKGEEFLSTVFGA
jgi:UDP-N-acetylglucosamine diphosphorylase / glucose-1-phosphate thymidylyltransferase / UDP-N-acetylgalactosamine diphosphorylase / glucosamine-1-phosphate N-acetyltransferase / galactosamine-1-phosphate N-acetyltransferase